MSKQNAKVIDTNEVRVLVSYTTPVAVYDKNQGQLFVTNRKYSNTTTKHINQFIRDHVRPETAANRKEVDPDTIKNLAGNISVGNL
jgi:hypothetical protein